MKYLGIVSKGHDASVTLVDGDSQEILFAGHAERYSHIKNDPVINRELLEDCFSHGTPDHIVWYETPWRKNIRHLLSGQYHEIQFDVISRHLADFGLSSIPYSTSSHHRSHASSSYFTGGMDDAAVLVVDAIGEMDTISIWYGQGTSLKKVYSCQYPDSLGLLYSAVTKLCGLKPNEEEYILMGMAAKGDPSRYHAQLVDEFIRQTPAPLFSLKRNVHRGIADFLPGEFSIKKNIQNRFDLAAAMQRVVEEYLCSVVRWMKEHIPSRNLVLSGGVMLNCVANSRIAAMNLYDNIWMMPNPGDAGSSLGAIASHLNKPLIWKGPYLGHDINRPYNQQGILSALMKNEIVGIANGRAEFGPRAFGNRSLVADPRGPDIKDRVNKIKHREPFRPFAPMIIRERAAEYFDTSSVTYSPYMQYTMTCLRPDLFPGICHVDGSSRVQMVDKKDNENLYNLLIEWEKQSGCPMLLNTSLNIKGFPLVNTWKDARDFQHRYKVKVF